MEVQLKSALIQIAALAALIAFSLLVRSVIFLALSARLPRPQGMFSRHIRKPTLVLVPVLTFLLVLPLASVSEELSAVLRRIGSVAIIGTLGWFAIGLLGAMEALVAIRNPISESDNLSARTILTRTRVLRGVGVVVVVVITVSIALLSFPSLSQLGLSLLASAGIATLAVGMAARPALTNLIAGLQIAFTQPIRLDDVVVINGEWGRIEEITSSYVVVRIWDLRRLIVPLSYFIEQPIENWTRQSSDTVGKIVFFADYSVPVDAIRSKIESILRSVDLWDGKIFTLQVTGASERAIELRALVGARNSSDAWDLCCLVREQVIAYLQRHHPESLPRTRAEFVGLPMAERG